MANQQELDECYNEHINNAFRYDESTGKIYWKITHLKGKEAGCIVSNRAGNNYRIVTFTYKGKINKIMSHRLCWILVYGRIPMELDHLDGDGLNNILCNLREVSRSENNKNHKRQSNNTSGIAGVSFRANHGDWRVYSHESNPKRKQIHIGLYKSFFEACCARKSYELSNGFSHRHGK